jgi:hypothetical protein
MGAAKKKAKCALATQLCSGHQIVRHYRGKKKGDPEFYACIACMAYLKLGRSVVEITS